MEIVEATEIAEIIETMEVIETTGAMEATGETMEAKEFLNGGVHHGHNIRRTRIEKNIKQDALSTLVNLAQSTVSRYEQTRNIDDEMLRRFARALDVPFEYLKNLEENAQTVVFENNTVNNKNNTGVNTQVGYNEESSTTNHNYPIDKITELYERLLKEKDEKFAALERRLANLEKSAEK